MSNALKVRKSSKTDEVVVINKLETEEKFFRVGSNESVEYMGSTRDGFLDSEIMGEVIDPDTLSDKTKSRISKWFNR